MRWILIILTAALVAGCGAETDAGGGGGASVAQLVVRLDADGSGPGKARELRLDCDSARESRACGAAAALEPADFAAVPQGRACTDLFGGPETARVSGELRGTSVAGEFKRQNGCEIKRWDALADLLAQVP